MKQEYLRYQLLSGEQVRVEDVYLWIGETQHRARNLSKALNHRVLGIQYPDLPYIYEVMLLEEITTQLHIKDFSDGIVTLNVAMDNPLPLSASAGYRGLLNTHEKGTGTMSKTNAMVLEGRPNFPVYKYILNEAQTLYLPENDRFIEVLAEALETASEINFSAGAEVMNRSGLKSPTGKTWNKDIMRDFARTSLVYAGYCRIFEGGTLRAPFRAYKAFLVKRIIPLSLWIKVNKDYAKLPHDFSCGLYAEDAIIGLGVEKYWTL